MKTPAVLGLTLLIFLSACAPGSPVTPAPAQISPVPTLMAPASPSEAPITIDSSREPTPFPTVQFTASPPAECSVIPVVPQVDPLAAENPPAETAFDHAYGSNYPLITILSYCGYQRPACASLNVILHDLQNKYAEEVRVIQRQYPQPQVDDKSLLAAYAVEAAADLGRYWQVHETLYLQQSEWVGLSQQEFLQWLAAEVDPLGISPDQLEDGINDPGVQARVGQALQDAAPLIISGTPVLFFNNILVKTRVNVDEIESLIRYFLLQRTAQTTCPALTIDPAKHYFATLQTEKGRVVVELFADKAPLAVNSFVHLAASGWYDGSTFYKVIPGYVVQGGDPSNSGLGGPGYGFTDELHPDLRFDQPGMLALNHLSSGLNGSQFFITYSAMPVLDGSFTIFGRVIEGMDVLMSLRPRNPESDEIILPAETLKSVTIEEQE